MKSTISTVLLAIATTYAALLPLEERLVNWTIGQTVQTSSGSISGHAASMEAEVSEYLGIPFAQAPIGNLRFAPPVKFTGDAPLSGSTYGFACPVKASSGYSGVTAGSLAAANVTAAGIAVLGLYSVASGYSEDCLNLNVWTKPQSGEAKKAVLVWIYGGSFTSGSNSAAATVGAHLAEQEDVVVVSLNYRLNILGFPGSPNITNNLAFLDQRLAIEWVRDNIANFGGDPDRITIFGQSAGAASVDYYTYAWNSDPIIAGAIIESGNVFGWGLPDTKADGITAWYTVAETLGCGNNATDQALLLACMRLQSYASILAAVPVDTGTGGILGPFGPTVDDVVVFSNYSQQAPASIPILIGSNDYEVGYFRTTFALAAEFQTDTFWDDFNLQSFTCPCGIRANASVSANNPTWRYRYHGVFPDVAVSSEAGAYHTAEIPQIFDTAPSGAGIPNATETELSIAKYMRGAWATFAKDPTQGLSNSGYGWPIYDPAHDTLIRLGYQNITGPNLINPYRYDADCVFVDVHSTNVSNAPDLPDLGAGVTPTGTRTGLGSTATSTAISTATSTRASSTSTAGAVSLHASVMVGMLPLVVAVMI